MNNAYKKDWLNPKEVYKEFGLSVSTLAKWRMKNKNIPFTKIGSAVKYKRSDIEAFLNAHIVAVKEVA